MYLLFLLDGYDPGWNDPPMFSYDSHSSQITSEKRVNILNKRVAFPLHSSPETSNKLPSIDPTLPPQPCDLASLPPPPCITSVNTSSNPIVLDSKVEEKIKDFDEEGALTSVMNNFDEVLERKSDNEELKVL